MHLLKVKVAIEINREIKSTSAKISDLKRLAIGQ